ncbi:MAG: SpaA isopeptide-forming pilin-related protein [Carnobacterium sp.]|uniref:SpaA isopeptide-forming pilin-related protein n=1 Tax=Carnobacterium sp. TaxID=48221 RepID=UPI002FC5E606
MKNKIITLFLVTMLVFQVSSPALIYAEGTATETNSSQHEAEIPATAESSLPTGIAPVEEPTTQVENEENSTEVDTPTKPEEVPTSTQAEENQPVEANEVKPETTNKQPETLIEKAPKLAITDNLFTNIKMYKINGDEVKENDIIPNMSGIKLNMTFSFTNKNYQTGDTFTTQLPPQIAIAKDLSGDFSPMTSAKWAIDAATKKLTITFLEDNIASEEYKLSLITSLEKVSNSAEENQEIIFTTTPNETIYHLEVTSNIDSGKSSTAITVGDFNPKTAKIESIFNLDRTDSANRRFTVEPYQSDSKLVFDSVKVSTSDVDFNGVLVGEKTELTEGVDFQVTKKNSGTYQATAEIKLTNKLNKKAIIVESSLSGINGKSYIDDSTSGNEYNYFYSYSYTYEDGKNSQYSFASQNFYTVQPLTTSGKINKETGFIDWTIDYNFNEQPLTTMSKLTTDLANQGVEYIPDSLKIEKIGFNYISGNNYTVIEQGDGADQWGTPSINTNGTIQMNANGATNQAYRVTYSTKITDPTERVITNKISDGTTQKEAKISLIPNLLQKESGKIDVFNQTMEWSITINAEKYTMKNPVIHDYFIDSVVSHTSLTVKKKLSETQFENLTEGIDYKVTLFDETGSPVGAQPNVNGAPASFNGGVRIDLLGEYAQLKDTLVVTINTKLNTSEEETEIKNKATLNYGDVPGVIEYEAKGTFIDPYYTGGQKMGEAAVSDGQYLYQNWLILVNSKGSNFNQTSLSDTLPLGSELVPGSLRFEEVTSQSMLDNMRNYLRYDYNLVPVGDDVYPTKIDTENNALNLEFNKLGSKRVYVKYKTRVKKDWYTYNQLKNKAVVKYDTKTAEYETTVYAYNYEMALTKAVTLDSAKENVANWTVTTKSISTNLPVENPVISDTLDNGSTNAAYDPISFVVKNTATGEKISSDHYSLKITGNTFTITFTDYKAESNIQVTYNTISEFPGGVKSKAQVDSASYVGLNAYYRQAEAAINLGFSSGSGSGIVKTADLTILKVDNLDESTLLAGATFEILKADGTETGLKGDTDAQGELTFTGLPLGDYQLKETKAPTGYDINPEYKTGKLISLTESMLPIKVTNERTFLNSVTLKKTAKESNESLAGAVFELQDETGTPLESALTTDVNGTLTLQDLKVGSYQFVETKAPTGYKLDETPLTFEIKKGQTESVEVAMTNELLPGGVVLTKTDEQSGETLQGAVFELQKNNKEVIQSGLTTDNLGKLAVDELKPGSYQFVETKAPTGYELDTTPVEFTIAKNQSEATEVTMTNKLTPSGIVITKTDDQTGEVLAGAVFELQDSEGKQVQSTLTTDESGKISVNDLAPNAYQLVETKAPVGYQLDATPVPFKIGKGQTEALKIAITNRANPSSVLLTKVDSQTGTVLQGAIFELQDQSGKVLQRDLVTNASGKLAVSGLKPGSYQFVETKAPTGYQLNQKPVVFTLEKDQTEAVNITVSNELIAGVVVLTKIDERSGETLAGAEFDLQDSQGNKLIQHMVTDAAGKLAINDLKANDYQLVETKAPAGYQLDQEPIIFTVEKGQSSALQLSKTNKAKQQTVRVQKKDAKTDELLAGAIFDLQDKDGKVIQKNLETGENGTLEISDLANGDYQLVETKAPTGYKLEQTPMNFSIAQGSDLITVDKYNDQLNNKTLPRTSVSKNNTYTLPKTGENPSVKWMVIGSLVVMTAMLAYIVQRRKGELLK